ncbi:cytochrome P450 [Streptomyces sp. CBMA156]|uniref:cytochrome P450 n=1 Tax=Streptomyces sp. CBMA156 TaxID=1930280 RepID=UPI0016618C70|nr:cytochrome P450 [Streptomyces sp. CBMA156]MBD0675546.1 cytochrome P450 [Streptomyces sp. CBMA156]
MATEAVSVPVPAGVPVPAPTSAIPVPAGIPLLGSLFDLTRRPLRSYLAARRDHGDVVHFQAGPPGLRADFYGVFSPEGVHQVLAGEAANFRKEDAFYDELRTNVGNGLLTSQDAEYQRQRRLVQPLFTRRRVDGYADAIAREAQSLADRWRAVPGGVVDAAEETSRFALRTVARVLFGTDVEEAVAVVHRSFPVLGEYVKERGYAPIRLPRTWPTPSNRRGAEARRALYEVCDRIIAERATRDGVDEAADDLLTLLGRARDEHGDRLDPDELRDQVLVFLLAGHETTATALAFALHLLAKHPEQRRLAREEARTVLAGRAPTAADLDALPYITRVLKEAMRLYPAAALGGRRAVAETVIGGYVIPAGAQVVVAPLVTHRHPDHWVDPERFDPDRFLPEAEKTRHRYAWFPFGGGPRACIGQHFSMLEAVLALGVLLRDFEIEAVDQRVALAQGITLRAASPMRIRVTAGG